MTFATLMVHLDVGQSNAPALQVAADLAERYKAGVIGVAACQPLQVDGSDGYMCGEVIVAEREIVDTELKLVEDEYRSFAALQPHSLGWRSATTMEPLSIFLGNVARGADLIITGAKTPRPAMASSRADTGELVMHAGRPVLVVPAVAATQKFDSVMVAWKDARETRRAVADALPLLHRATLVTVAEIALADELGDARARVDDVVQWLARHGITAKGIAAPCVTDDAAGLVRVADEVGADIVVAGAYGHSRVREWAFGGVTRDLLLRPSRSAFLSH